jgi:TRAP-type mannitol/chloroaromatic compound transport system permease small subunit
MKALLALSRGIDAISEFAGKIAKYLVLVVILVGFVNVVLRYTGRFTNQQLASNTFIEAQWYIFSVIFLLGFSYILKHNANVRVDFLYARWSPRRKALVDFFGTLFFLIPFTLIGIYISLNPVLQSWGQLPDGTIDIAFWEISPDPDGLPRAPIKTMLIVGLMLLFLQAVSQLIKNGAMLTGHLKYEQEPELEEQIVREAEASIHLPEPPGPSEPKAAGAGTTHMRKV